MLLEFRTKNFKSFLEEMIFSLQPAPKQTDLSYSILKEKNGKKTFSGLSSAVIYGPNAAGKSNIICAMDVLKRIILTGHIRNDEKYIMSNPAAGGLELIPNSHLEHAEPVFFSIRFTNRKLVFLYELELDLGLFLDSKYERQILSERLEINGREVFKRQKNQISLFHTEMNKKYLVPHFQEGSDTLIKIARSSANRQELFLTNGFRSYVSMEIVEFITSWFKHKFLVYYHSDNCRTTRSLDHPAEQVVYIEKYMDEASRAFGISSNGLGYVIPENETEPKLCSMLHAKIGKYLVPAEVYESFGTVRFVEVFPAIVEAFVGGGTLVVDEFDAAIHPMALMSVINAFHNDAINTRNAQFVFNTHNPIYLSANLFRRDEIKFVERDESTGHSNHYALSDFGTAGSKGVRKGEDYLRNYFISRYGAIKAIDFSDLLERVMSETPVKEPDDE